MTGPPAQDGLRERRIERLRREIALLEAMDGRLWRRATIWAVAGVIITALLLVAVAAKLDYFAFHPLAVTLASVAIASVVWWLGRYSLAIPVVLVFVLLAVLTESADFGDWGDGGSRSRKPDRRMKVSAALAKRRSRLARLEERA